MTLEYDTMPLAEAEPTFGKVDTGGDEFKSNMNVVNLVNDYNFSATKDSGFNEKDVPIKANIRHF